ncbi:MAG TPA: hypothetical protein VKQ72_04990, partial [Aggregatilineales bacterium]|nr:hypothetical protein [Aggregatilineales bacterium]
MAHPIRLSRLAVFAVVGLLVIVASLGLPSLPAPSQPNQAAAPHTLPIGPHSAAASAPRVSCDPGYTWATGEDGAAGQCLAISGDVASCLAAGGVPAIYPSGFFCGGVGQPTPPPPVPDKPGVNVGAACIAGDTRVVKLSPGNNSSGATFDVRMATDKTKPSTFVSQGGSQTTYTYSGLLQDTPYYFQAQATNQYGSSGWTGWVGPVKQDLNPPTTTYTPVGTAGTNLWWKSNVTVSLPAVDSGCLGVKTTTYTLDSNPPATYTGTPFPVNGDGIHSLSFFSTDGVHDETPQSVNIKIDTTPPSLSMTPSRPPDTAFGWWHSTPTITLAVSDATSGVASTMIQIDGGAWTAWNGKGITFRGDLKHTLNVIVTDNAGNVTTNGWIFPVDGTPPQVGIAFDKPHGPNGWFTSSPVEAILTISDNLSGIARAIIQVDGKRDSSRLPVVGDGVHIVAWFVYDKAGNQNASMLPVQIDTAPPDVGSVSCGPSSIAPGQSWSLGASVGDNASGVSSLSMNVNGPGGGSSGTNFPPGTLSTNATLSFTPTTVGNYSVDLVLTDWAAHTTTRGGVCSFSVAPLLFGAALLPTTTGTPTPIYEIVTNTPTSTPSDTPEATGTIPPTNTPQPGLDNANGGAGDATQPALAPMATATPTAVAVAMALPGSNSNNTGGGSTGGGNNSTGTLESVTPPPDLNNLLAQAGLLGGAGAVIAAS